MKLGALKEVSENESRVSLSPESALHLVKLGHDCLIEAGAGEG
ncbi:MULTISPECIES: hypothetical protein, partial [unclassified Rhizobium]